MILALFLATAEAGKLSEGFRGLPFGTDAILAKPPMAGCKKFVQSKYEWSWMCETDLNGVPVVASYASSHGYFYAVTALASESVTHAGGMAFARQLREGAIGAWGPGIQMDPNDFKLFPDWWWSDGDVGALLKYDSIKERTTLTIADLTVKHQRDAAAARDAAGSRGDF